MNMLPIQPIAETADSVTLSRSDFAALTDMVTDAIDLADVEAVKRRLTAGETEAFPIELADRLLKGNHPVRIFRQHRGFGLRQLAVAANVSPSYLSEVEAGAKPGSIAFMRRVAAVLGVSIDLLVDPA